MMDKASKQNCTTTRTINVTATSATTYATAKTATITSMGSTCVSSVSQQSDVKLPIVKKCKNIINMHVRTYHACTYVHI